MGSLEQTVADDADADPRVTGRRGACEVSPGARVDRYVLGRKLGSGAMGVVFEAHDPELDRKVAVKLLHETDVATQNVAVEEARALARVDHPNVVEVFDVGRDRGHVFVTMELIDGDNLETWLEQHRDWPTVLDVFVQAGRGLAAVHGAGLVHRDFKPSNVMLGKDGRARVMDFGLVQTAPTLSVNSESEERPDNSRSIVGTPVYMAPEQHMGLPCDPAADQFSFGVALHEALYGAFPFRGKTVGELALAKSEAVIDAPRSSAVPPWAHEVVVRALRPQPSERYPSMEALLAALEARRRSRPVRRRTLGVVGVAAVLVAIAIPSTGHDPCREGAEGYDAVWNRQRRRAVEAAFEATKVSYATDAFARVDRQLSDYGKRWRSTYVETCGASRDDELDARMSCMRRRLANVDALVSILETADATQVEQAVRAASILPRVERCTTYGSPQPAVAPPDDPARRAETEELRAELARSHALRSTGRFDQALALIREVVSRAEAIDDRSLVAAAMNTRADILQAQGDYAGAEESAAAAFSKASEAGDGVSAFEAARSLLVIVGSNLHRPNDALAWGRHARALMERLPEDPEREADLLESLGMVCVAEGRFDEAEEHFERVRILWTGLVGEDAPQLASTQAHLAVVAAQQGRFDDAIGHHNRALAIDTAALGPEHPELANSHNSLGMVRYLQGKHVDALSHFTRALEVWERARTDESPELATFLNNRALALEGLGRLDEATEHYRRALTIRQRTLGPDHPLVAHVVANIGNVALREGRYEEARAAYERARSMLERALGPEHPDVALATSNLGGILKELGRAEEARRQYNAALDTMEKTLGPDHPSLADVLDNLGSLDEEQGKLGQAHARLQRSLEIREANDMGTAERREELRRRIGSIETQLAAAGG